MVKIFSSLQTGIRVSRHWPISSTIAQNLRTRALSQSKSAKITQWSAADINAQPKSIGLDGSPTRVVKIFTPPPRKGGEMLKGDKNEVSTRLAELLKDILI